MNTTKLVSAMMLIGLVAGCASPPKAQNPSGKNRIPINNEATLAAYSAEAARQDAEAKRLADLQVQLAGQQREIAALKAYIIEKDSIDQINTPKGVSVLPKEKGEPTLPVPTLAKPQPSLDTKNPPSAKISQAEQPTGTTTADLAAHSTNDRVQIRDTSMLFTVTHAIASTAFVPGDVEAALLEAARSSQKIVIRGRTDAVKPNPVDQRLAMGRANKAMRFLLLNGVPRDRISVRFQSAGGFATENITQEGKARNRRVEIETFGVVSQNLAKHST